MSVSGVSNSSNTSSPSAIDAKTIAGNFDTFLQLLTTQLKNQNPLDPLDTNQFTQQLVQFSSVEQQLKTNDYPVGPGGSNANTVQTSAVNYIGKTVTASGDPLRAWSTAKQCGTSPRRMPPTSPSPSRTRTATSSTPRPARCRPARRSSPGTAPPRAAARPLTAPIRSTMQGTNAEGKNVNISTEISRHRHRRRLHRRRAGAAGRQFARQPLWRDTVETPAATPAALNASFTMSPRPPRFPRGGRLLSPVASPDFQAIPR